MPFNSISPAWPRYAIAPLALAGGIGLAVLPGAPGLCLGTALLGAALCALLVDRRRHHVRMQARFCEEWPHVASPWAASASPPEALGLGDVERRRRRIAAKAADLRLALADEAASSQLERQLRDLMDALSQHVRCETDLLARQPDARRREDVDAARLQLANAEHDFRRYCIGELALPQLVDRVTAAVMAGQPAPELPGLSSREAAPGRQGEVDA